jgi:asparagine synthase (glutamine-hydrolysing)
MCAIIGIVGDLSKQVIDNFRQCRDLMVHRGPDQAGEWIKYDTGVALANRRLSVFDLTSASNQPFVMDSENLVLVFNGAIFNFIELRETLKNKGHVFKTNGDSEVLLYAYKEWGFDCLKYLNGMWAFAIYDQRRGPGHEQLFVARDRAGEKPFYYRCRSGGFEFASELKGLIGKNEINLQALNHYLAFGYVPGDLCIESGVLKLPPAHAGVFDFKRRDFKKWRYWQLPAPNYGATDKINSEELAEQAWDLLTDSVKLRLRADVPAGIFLSGGLDSSLITAAAAQVSSQPIETFTIGVPGTTLDETEHAQLIANTFNTKHHLLPIDSPSLYLLDEFKSFIDEPIADSSMLPSFLVSRMTRKHVTVALGGDGGDELYGGYKHYKSAVCNQDRLGWLPMTLLKIGAKFASKLSAGIPGRNLLASLREGPLQASLWGTPFFDLTLRKRLFTPEILAELGDEIDAPERRSLALYQKGFDPVDKLMRMDFLQTLPDDYLVKVDRASMANSLEVRSPFLDYRLVEHAYKLIPTQLKVTTREQRYLQKLMAKKYLPKEFVMNRKQGFSIPMDLWMKNIPLEQFLSKNLKNIFNTSFISDLVFGQSNGKRNGARLYALNMLKLMDNK